MVANKPHEPRNNSTSFGPREKELDEMDPSAMTAAKIKKTAKPKVGKALWQQVTRLKFKDTWNADP